MQGELVVLHEFLKAHESEILASCQTKSLELEGMGVPADEIQTGLPIFFAQLMTVLEDTPIEPEESSVDRPAMARAASAGDEPAIARAAGRPFEAEVAIAAGNHG